MIGESLTQSSGQSERYRDARVLRDVMEDDPRSLVPPGFRSTGHSSDTARHRRTGKKRGQDHRRSTAQISRMTGERDGILEIA